MNNNLMAAANALKQLNDPQAARPIYTQINIPTYQPQSVNMSALYQARTDNMDILRKQIRTLRQAAGMSQRELARLSGMSQGTITRAECHGWCSIDCFMKIAFALNKQLTIS